MASTVKLLKSLNIRRIHHVKRCLSTTTTLSKTVNTQEPGKGTITHTGQDFKEDDYRNARFIGASKLVTEKWAIDMVADDPVVVCTKSVVYSDSKGPLGHPRVYINLNKPGIHSCGYSGRRFILKKFYNAAEHGDCITYDEYLKEMDSQPKNYPA